MIQPLTIVVRLMDDGSITVEEGTAVADWLDKHGKEVKIELCEDAAKLANAPASFTETLTPEKRDAVLAILEKQRLNFQQERAAYMKKCQELLDTNIWGNEPQPDAIVE